MDLNKVGKLIANERKRKKLTQFELSEILGVGEKTVSKWERGVNAPDISMLLKLCEVLELDIKELLSGERNNNEIIDSKELVELNKRAVEGLKYYTNKSKLKYLYMFIGVTFIIVFSFILLFFVNNYNRFKVYSLKSSLSDYTVDGYVFFNKSNNFIVIDSSCLSSLLNNDIYVSSMKVLVRNGDKIIYSTKINNEDGTVDAYLLNRELSKIKMFIFEEESDDLSIIDNIDLNKLYINISYEDNLHDTNEITIPLQVEKEYSNTVLF